MLFGTGVLADEDVPSDVEFKLDPNNTDSLPMCSTGETITYRDPQSDLIGYDFITTYKVYYIEVPEGTSEIYAPGSDKYQRSYVKNANTDNLEIINEDWGGSIYVNGSLIWNPFPIKTSLDYCFSMVDGNSTEFIGTGFNVNGYIFYCVEAAQPSVKSLYTSSIANYTGNACTLTVGGTFENAENDTPVTFYVTDKENGTSKDAVEGTLKETSAANVSWNQSDVEISTNNFDAGEYWVAAEVGDTRQYQPFTMYATARNYAEGMLDLMTQWYKTRGFYNGEDYVGLSADSGNGTGIDWEAYIFGARGYKADDPLLTAADGKTYLDMYAESFAEPTVYPIQNEGAVPAAKPYARMTLGITGIGGDPRHIGAKNLVRDLISIAYENGDIENGKLRLDEDGSLHVRIANNDTIAEAYLLLALEIVNATPEEGYTEELRAAGLKTLINTGNAVLGGMEDDDIPWLSAGANISDFYSMTLFACEYLNDVKGMEGEGQKLLDQFKEHYASVIAKGSEMNVFSVAMATTDLVSAGVTFEEYTTDAKWRDADGRSELSKLLGNINQNGGVGFFGDRMGQYEVMQALVDLLNGKTCFRKAQERYMENYPQYFDTEAYPQISEEGQALMNAFHHLPKTVDSIEDIKAVNDVRDTYESFMSNLSEKANPEEVAAYYKDVLNNLTKAEEECTQYVKGLIADLPSADDQIAEDDGAVDVAVKAYGALTEQEAAGVSSAEKTKLRKAQSISDTYAAAEAARLILALPDADGVVAADAGDILAARAAYNGLSEQQRKLVDGKTAAKLVSAERALEQLGAAAVKAAVAAIPGMSDLSLDDAAFVEEVRAAYDALSDVQKLAVTNIADLIKAETKLQKLAKTAAADQAAASAVADAIAALGKAENIGAADEKEVKAARKAYSKLTDAQKALVANEEDLIAAEKAVDSAKKAAAQTAADEAAADRAEKAIAAIGEVTPGSEKAIANAREIYDALSDEQKSLVENGDVLMAAESEWAELTDEAEQAKTEAEAAAKAMADQKAADQAVSAIEAIGEVTLGSEKAIAKARAAYDGLSDDQKELVENAADLETAEEALAQLKTDTAAANAVRDLIDRLSDGDEITLADAKEAAAARKAFSRLSDAQKALVDNEDVLKAAEEAIGDLKAADAVEKAIDAVGEVTINSEEAIKAARAAYDALTDVQKDRVRNAAALTDAEKRWAELTGQRFVDVTQGMYCFDAVRWAVENGVTLGTDENHFSPDSACTRGQVVTFLWRAAGSPEVIAEHSFVDVAAGSYYEKAVLWAAAEEITEGTSDTTFSPNDPCTRGQVATFLWRAKGQPAAAVNSANPFTDVLPGSYYETAVLWAAANGVTNGIGENRFAPNDPCTRGQVVTFLFRAR